MIFKWPDGKFFYVDRGTGAVKSISADMFNKMAELTGGSQFIKYAGKGNVFIRGISAGPGITHHSGVQLVSFNSEVRIKVEPSSLDASVRTLSKPAAPSAGGGSAGGAISAQDFHFVMNFACCGSPADTDGDGAAGRRQHKPIVFTREWAGHNFKVEIDGMIVSGQLLARPAPRK